MAYGNNSKQGANYDYRVYLNKTKKNNRWVFNLWPTKGGKKISFFPDFKMIKDAISSDKVGEYVGFAFDQDDNYKPESGRSSSKSYASKKAATNDDDVPF